MADLLSPSRLLEMMEGNRRLTLRVIEAFPEERLFSFSPAEPLRPFGEMAIELMGIEEGYVRGIATAEWIYPPDRTIKSKAELLSGLEAVRHQTRSLWPRITVDRLLSVETDPFFGGEQSHLDRLIYALENEIHHRGQGMVYLRQLGIEPPRFWER